MKKILVVALIIGSLGFVNKSFAQAAGALDPSFGVGGELSDTSISPFIYSGLALSPGGEFVVSTAQHDTIQVIRYTSVGNRDINFGLNSSGYVKVVVPGFSGIITSSLVQTDQKILIAGQYASSGLNQKGYILRLNSDGTIDNAFGSSGWFFFNFFPQHGESVRQLALQSNGDIVSLDAENFAGLTDTFVVTRIKSNGTYDNSFATNGQYKIPFYNFLATSPSVFQLDANNNFTFAAYSNYQSSDYFYLFRLNSNGVLDTTYGNAGTILIDSTNIINGGSKLGLNFQSDGKLITVQNKLTGSLLWAVCRYNTDGSVDQGFGPNANGMVVVSPNLAPVPFDLHTIVSTSTGLIYTAGVVTVAGSNRLMVNKFNADGSGDAAFGNNQGSTLLNCFERDDYVYNMLIQPDGKLLINGLVNEINFFQYNQVVRLLGAATTSVEEISGNTDFSVYPNPAGSEVNFELPKPSAGTICLKDMTGNVVITMAASNSAVQTMDISKLSAGVYVATWLNEENTVSKKIIKQ